MDEAILERLIPAGEAFDLLARAYDLRGQFADWDVCQRVAVDALLDRLVRGQLTAWSTACFIDCDNPQAGPLNEIISPYDFLNQQQAGEVPVAFWHHYQCAGPNNRQFDPVTGDCKFGYSDHDYSLRDGSAFGIHFDRRGLPSIAVPSWSVGQAANSNSAQTASEPQAVERNKGGRPPLYDWEMAKAAVTLECASRVTITTSQAEIEEAFKLWFARRGESPSDSVVRDHAGPLHRALKCLSAGEADNLAA
jgi:hypothetical protein